MNNVIISGRLAADPEMRTTKSGLSNATFRVAVRRDFANANGVHECDFFTCVAWRKSAEYIHKYFIKGSFIIVEGALQNRSYEAQDGTKRYVTELIVAKAEFGGGKAGAESEARANPNESNDTDSNNGFTEIDDSELPF